MLAAEDSVIRELVLEYFSLNAGKISGYDTKVELLCFEKDSHISKYKKFSNPKEKVCKSIF